MCIGEKSNMNNAWLLNNKKVVEAMTDEEIAITLSLIAEEIKIRLGYNL